MKQPLPTRWSLSPRWRNLQGVTTLVLLAGCAALTPDNKALEDARRDYQDAQSTEVVFLLAGRELDQARIALRRADDAWIERASKQRVAELAGVVIERVHVARTTASRRVLDLQSLGNRAR